MNIKISQDREHHLKNLDQTLEILANTKNFEASHDRMLGFPMIATITDLFDFIIFDDEIELDYLREVIYPKLKNLNLEDNALLEFNERKSLIAKLRVIGQLKTRSYLENVLKTWLKNLYSYCLPLKRNNKDEFMEKCLEYPESPEKINVVPDEKSSEIKIYEEKIDFMVDKDFSVIENSEEEIDVVTNEKFLVMQDRVYIGKKDCAQLQDLIYSVENSLRNLTLSHISEIKAYSQNNPPDVVYIALDCICLFFDCFTWVIRNNKRIRVYNYSLLFKSTKALFKNLQEFSIESINKKKLRVCLEILRKIPRLKQFKKVSEAVNSLLEFIYSMLKYSKFVLDPLRIQSHF